MIVLRNESNINKVNKKYISIINEAVNIYKHAYADDIEEIRLQGSVSRGEEIESVSDLDMLCILKEDKKYNRKDGIIEAEINLSAKMPELTGLDLEVTNEKNINENYAYWLIVCTDSLCLCGSNKYYQSEIQIEGSKLAKLWNPSTEYLIESYKQKLFETDDENEIKKICKWVGKDLLKSFRPRLMDEYDIFHKTIEKTYEDLCVKYSMNTEYYRVLLDLYLNQTYDKKMINDVLSMIEENIVEFKTSSQ